MVTSKNPHVKPAAIPGTGGDVSFKKKTQTSYKNSNVKRGVKARYFGARTGCQFGTTPTLFTKRSKRFRTWQGARKAYQPSMYLEPRGVQRKARLPECSKL